MAGMDLRTAAELLGYKTPQMVMRHAYLALERQASAVGLLVRSENQRDTKSDIEKIVQLTNREVAEPD
jgi:hypothetical protein